MNITNVVNKLKSDYQNTQNIINKSIKYSFDYHNSHTSIYYLQENDLQNQILLVICVNNKYYLTTITFSLINNEYNTRRYIPDEIYPYIKNEMFEKDNYSPVPYFNKMFSVILNNDPITTNYKVDTENCEFHTYKDHKECPLFETFIRKSISPDMKEKIYKRYSNELAKEIIKYCYQTGETLRFTSDFNKSHDIIILMNSGRK